MKPMELRTVELTEDQLDILDNIVHETASDVAAGVNNGGSSAQYEYLLSNGWTEEQILRELGLL